MYKKSYISTVCLTSLTILFFASYCSFAAENAAQIQWATKVLGFTSQLSDESFSARQLLGRPNATAAGHNPLAWSAEGYRNRSTGQAEETSRTQILHLEYRTPIHVRQVAVVENFNPGALKILLLLDEEGNERKVYETTPTPLGSSPRTLNLFIPLTAYKVKSIKLIMDVAAVPGFNQVDAVAISNGEDSVKSELKIVSNLPKGLKRENLGANINTKHTDFTPVISPDGKTLYFSRNYHPENFGGEYGGQDIWYSELDAKKQWTLAKNIGAPLNNVGSNAVLSVTPDGNTLLLNNRYASNGSAGGAGFSITHKTKDGWEHPQDVRVRGFYNRSRYAEAFLSGDGKVIIMAVERDDSFGDRDLYFSKLMTDGTWSVPQDMGLDVNSVGNETTPFLAADGKTLYFSSDGLGGYGNLDIFMSRRLDDSWTRWSEPENLGPEINTPGFDAYFTLSASGEYAYCVSNENSLGREDIFRIKLPEQLRPAKVVLVEGKVLDESTKKPVDAKIVYEILPEGEEIGVARSNPNDGSYKISLPAGAMYGFRAEAKGYYPISDNLDVRSLKQYSEMTKDLYLVPIRVGSAIRLNNIFFATGKWELEQTSFPELNRVAEFLTANPQYNVEVAGHTDNVGSATENKTLSENRAKAVYEYLLQRGASRSRIRAKGYGSEKPIAKNTTENGRQQNRRVEFIIVK